MAFQRTLSYSLLFFFILLISFQSNSQRVQPSTDLGSSRGLGNALGGIRNLGSRFTSGSGTKDSLQPRDRSADSINIKFRYLDDSRSFTFDSSLNDYYVRFPIPSNHLHLGNVGNATKPLTFTPNMKPGWDAGLHAFDVYMYKTEDVRFFTTNKPYTLLSYTIGSSQEQQILIQHSQNIKPNWNFNVQYRLINALGFFQNQNVNHNNYIFNSWYQGRSKRYTAFFILMSSKIGSSENGGLTDVKNLNEQTYLRNRFTIPVNMGGTTSANLNLFNTNITTGNKYASFTALFRHQYDLGKKDSLVTDSTVIPLFYPRLRFEHTIQYNTYRYQFVDNLPDSAYYRNFGFTTQPPAQIDTMDKWKEIINDFSIIQFPEMKNLQQFIKVGASLQNLSGNFITHTKNFYNIFLHGEYRNKTRNKKWDIELNGNLYVAGLNNGDYNVVAFLRSFVGKKLGFLELGFKNTNRTPSFIFNNESNFQLGPAVNFKKENITNLFAAYELPSQHVRLSGYYYLVSNYTYFTKFYLPQQESTLFNVLQLRVEKEFRLTKRWHWYADIVFQQKDGSAPINIPTIFTRHRIAYEGHLLRNLDASVGLDIRYHTPYKADGYSALNGQFYLQDSIKINNRPDIAAFLHLRITRFTAYLRVENLNSVTFSPGFGFTRNNFSTPFSVYPGMMIRLGIFWSFIN